MNLLPIETWNIILSSLESNRDKYYLLITCKDISKCDVLFNEEISLVPIFKSQWFDYFTIIRSHMCSQIRRRPKHVKEIWHDFDDNWKGDPVEILILDAEYPDNFISELSDVSDDSDI